MNRTWLSVLAAVVGSWAAAFLGAYFAVSVRTVGQIGSSGGGPHAATPETFPAPLAGRSLPEGLEQKPAASGEALTEPGRLPPSVPAAALKTRRDPPADAVRTVIQQEMPDASPEEVEVWAEQLKGLGPEAAREILKLRSVLGRPWETSHDGTERQSRSSGARPVRYVDLQ